MEICRRSRHLIDVGDVYLLTLQPHGDDHLIEQFARATHKKGVMPCKSSFSPETFADEKYFGIDIPFAEHRVGARFSDAGSGDCL